MGILTEGFGESGVVRSLIEDDGRESDTFIATCTYTHVNRFPALDSQPFKHLFENSNQKHGACKKLKALGITEARECESV